MEHKTKDPTAAADSTGDRNIMPSMVVRQQRLAQCGLTSFNPNKVTSASAKPITQVNTTQELCKSAAAAAASLANDKQQQHLFDQNGLIVPKKVTPVSLNLSAHSGSVVGGGLSGCANAGNIHGLNSAIIIPNTVLDLNRELKFNQAHGKNVLDKKSELRRAMDKLEANRKRKEAEVERLNRRSSLELRLEQRAEKIGSGQSQVGSSVETGVLSQSKPEQPRAASAEDTTSKVFL